MRKYNVTITLPHSLLTHDPGGVTLLGFRVIGAGARISCPEPENSLDLRKGLPC
jgi:hypothetical protein